MSHPLRVAFEIGQFLRCVRSSPEVRPSQRAINPASRKNGRRLAAAGPNARRGLLATPRTPRHAASSESAPRLKGRLLPARIKECALSRGASASSISAMHRSCCPAFAADPPAGTAVGRRDDVVDLAQYLDRLLAEVPALESTALHAHPATSERPGGALRHAEPTPGLHCLI